MKACENVIWSFDNTFNTLYAHWEQRVYSVTYSLNGGENNPENPQTFTSNQVVELKEPTRRGYVFLGWYLNGEKVEKLQNFYTSVTLDARWLGTEYNLTKKNFSLKAEYSILNCGFADEKIEYTVSVGNNVKRIYLHSGLPIRKSITMQILILPSGSNEVDVIFDGLNVTAPVACNVIHEYSGAKIHLYAHKSTLSGANGVSQSSGIALSQHGTAAIQCKYIELHTPIKIVGGNGYLSEQGMAGFGISVVSGGSVRISSDDITIIGGDGYGNPTQPSLLPPVGAAAIGGCKPTYSGEYKNVVLQHGG